MWKQLNKIGPNKRTHTKMAVINHKKKLVSKEEEVTNALLKEIHDRVRRRPQIEEYKEVKKLEDRIFNMKVGMAKTSVSIDFAMGELKDVLTN